MTLPHYTHRHIPVSPNADTTHTDTHTHALPVTLPHTQTYTHPCLHMRTPTHTHSLFLSHRRARDPTVPPTQTHTRVSQCGHQTHTHTLFLSLSLSGGHATLPHHTHGHTPVSPHQPHVPRSSALSKGAVAHSHGTSHEPKTPQPPAPLTVAQKVMCVCVYVCMCVQGGDVIWSWVPLKRGVAHSRVTSHDSTSLFPQKSFMMSGSFAEKYL